MIQWIRAKLYDGYERRKLTGHLFQCGENSISFRRLGEGDYPPFDCLNLTLADAINLRNWLNEIIVSYQEIRNH
jgi:hypothetical protein